MTPRDLQTVKESKKFLFYSSIFSVTKQSDKKKTAKESSGVSLVFTYFCMQPWRVRLSVWKNNEEGNITLRLSLEKRMKNRNICVWEENGKKDSASHLLVNFSNF